MPQPHGPSYAGPPIATIDCEPFAIFKSAEARGNLDLAKDFLKMFYSKSYYLPFVRAVPIHLTPIFRGMAGSQEYANDPFVGQWKQWADQTSTFLSDPQRVRPILMPDVSEAGRSLPFLLEFQASQILTRAVADVVSAGRTVDVAAQDAQGRAERLVQSTGERAW
jgi:ABC-type glycerol-3-phosphate transport system substrate-binding protein